MAHRGELRPNANAIGVQFLLTELQLAMTFMDVAQTTGIQKTAARNHKNARIAYDTVLRLLPKLTPTVAEQKVIDDGLAVVKARLIGLGQQF